jgi:hypothetical protein
VVIVKDLAYGEDIFIIFWGLVMATPSPCDAKKLHFSCAYSSSGSMTIQNEQFVGWEIVHIPGNSPLSLEDSTGTSLLPFRILI